jgi:hypothetical protein
MTQYNLDYSDAYEVIGLKELVQKYNFFRASIIFLLTQHSLYTYWTCPLFNLGLEGSAWIAHSW